MNGVLDTADGRRFVLNGEPCDVEDFLSVNELAPEDEAAIRSLRPGQTFRGGGGAWGEWTLTVNADEPE